MADRIVQRISLEGAEDVQAKLKKTGEVGAKALAATNRTIEDQNSGLGKYGDVFASLNGKTDESRESIERVKKLVETIKPAVEKAGIELGSIGEFSKIGRGGVIALAGAFGTTLAAAIEKAGDTARDQAQRLGTFTGSAQKGVETYNAIKKTASELEVPNSGLAAPFEQLLRANQRSGAGLGGENLQGILRTLFQGASADRVPLDQSQQGITGLLQGLREQGQLTPEVSAAAQNIFPTLMKRLSEDLQKSFPNQVGAFSTPQVLKSLQNIGPQIAKDLEASKEAFPSSIEDSLNKLKSSAGNLNDALNGTTIISSVLDGAAKVLDTVSGGINKVKESAAAQGVLTPTVPVDRANRIREQRGIEPVQAPQQYDFLRRPSSTQADEQTAFQRFWTWLNTIKATPYQPEGGFQPEAPAAASQEKAATAAEKMGDALSGAADQAKSAEETFKGFNARGAEQLGVISSKLTAEQARIDYEHKPEETDIQIGRDQLAVQNAAIAKQSAIIGIQDAAKNKELANLAPEQAESASRSAESRYTKALSNLRRLQGYDTSFIDRTNPIRDAIDELNDADTARKVADVNRRYAYLEPRKAELAQQKAQTDLTSADYLQRDSSLKLAKDREGRQLSNDVAGLRYAQAQLDTQEKIAKSGEVSNSLLDKILSTLQRNKSSGSQGGESGQSEKSGEVDQNRSTGGSRSGNGSDISGSSGSFSSRSGSSAPESLGGEKLIEKSGVVNIPPGTPQDQINDALAKQRAQREKQDTAAAPVNPQTPDEQAAARYYGREYQNLPDDLKASPIYKKQFYDDERRAAYGAGKIGAEPIAIDTPRKDLALNDRVLYYRKKYPSPFDKDKRDQAEVSHEQMTDVPRWMMNRPDSGLGKGSIAGPGVGGGLIRPTRRDQEEMQAEDSRRARDFSKKALGPYNVPPKDFPSEGAGPVPFQPGTSTQTPTTKEGFQAALDSLLSDWKSQRELNAQLHNGSFESRTVGTQNSPMARTPSGVSQIYPPPVRGHYDENFNFVPDVPTYSGLGRGSVAGPGSAGASIPATNDYEFAGRKNPAGPYQEGISAPLSFPQYNRDQQQSLPSIFPNGVPLPQPRPPEAGPGQQSSLPSPQEVASLGDAFRSLIEGISASINSAKQQNNTVDNPEAVGIRGESESNSSSDVGQPVDKADKSLEEFAQAVSEAATAVRKSKSVEEDDTTYAATGGFISGPGSTTSDSVPAMLSNKEYVLNAEATQRIGKSKLDAINFGGKSLHHFAIGGPVGFMGDVGLPHVSAASIANVGGADHLGTVDLRTNHGDFSVGASRSTLDDLQKASVMAQLARTGPAPSWSGA